MSKHYLRSNILITKPILLWDMDGVLCDFDKRVLELEAQGIKGHKLFSHTSAYKDLEPIEGAIEAWNTLQDKFENYILSTPPWSNPEAWAEKRKWVDQYLGKTAHKKLILSHNKGLIHGNYLIDDRIANGVGDFKGEHIHIFTPTFPDWNSVLKYLK